MALDSLLGDRLFEVVSVCASLPNVRREVFITLAEIRRTLNVFLGNSQLYGSLGTIDVIGEIFKLQKRYAEELRDDWMQLYKSTKLTGWRRGEAATRSGRLSDGHPLLNMIEEEFPEVVGSVSAS